MKIKIALKNPRTGEIRAVKLGFSWTLFFFSGFLGLPLFMRRLYGLAAVFLVLWAANLALPRIATSREDQAIMSWTMLLIIIGLSVWMGRKGNEYTAKQYLDSGWTFAEPNSDLTRLAAQAWGVAAPPEAAFAPVSPHNQRIGA